MGPPPTPDVPQVRTGGGTIRLQSGGGSLVAGLQLGYLIRKYRLTSTIGRTTPEPDKGYCASACVYAFLGGVRRILPPDAMLGVHRFYKGSAAENLPPEQYSPKDLDDTQRIFAALVLFIRAMGVDTGVVGLTNRAAPDQIYWITQAEAQALRITTDLDSWSAWKIEPFGSGVVAYSERGDAKARMTLYCSSHHGRFLQLAAQEWDTQYAAQIVKCGPNGWHPVLGALVSNDNAAAITLNDGTAGVRFRLPAVVPFSDATFFQFDPYPMACRANLKGTTDDLAQSARVAFSNCIE